MKPIHEWIADMSNSIEDASAFAKDLDDIRRASQGPRTELQKRMLLADVLVPYTPNLDLVSDWLAALCVTLRGVEGRRSVCEAYLFSITNDQLSAEWAKALTDTEAVLFKVKLKNLINDGLEAS